MVEQKSWTVNVDGAQHTVVLDWTYWGGRREVSLDGQAVGSSTIPMRWRSEQAFQIDGHPAVCERGPPGRSRPGS